jgi:nucleoside-diphosphate-sugar epimerase
MLKVLIIGCGDLGGAVARQLLQLGIQATGVRRSDNAAEGVSLICADVTQAASLQVLVPLRPEILIYCVAANGQSDEQYKAHYVDGLRHVLATQSENPRLKHVFFVSSTRVYGQDTEDIFDESIEAVPADFAGERLLEAENLLKDLSCNTTILRLSGIYGAGRLRMINIAKSPEKWPLQNSWSNRIHRDDAAAFIVFLVQRVFVGEAIRACYIVTDSRPASQYDVLNWIAARMHLNGAELVDTPIKGGKRLSNQAMLATGFILQYPDYQAGYRALLSSISSVQTEVLRA